MIFPSTADWIEAAAQRLRSGKLVVFPTETVYGLGADATNQSAVAAIFTTKNRPAFNPLIIHVGRGFSLSEWVVISPDATSLISAFWPGPLTLVLNKTDRILDIVTSGLPTVGIRCPDHPVAAALLESVQQPIAAPSANRFGMISPTKATHVESQLPDQWILDGGPCSSGVESTIISLASQRPIILRHGGIPLSDIQSVIGPVDSLDAYRNRKLDSPGQLTSHYAPKTPLFLQSEFDPAWDGYRVGVLAGSVVPSGTFSRVEVLSPSGDLFIAARNLFSALHRLDSENLDIIWAIPVPEIGIGQAIMDRLRRAQFKNK